MLEFEGQLTGDPKKTLGTAGRRAGSDHVYSHLLRHTVVTWLVQAGVPRWEVAGWVGMSVEMIERVYGHHSPDRFAAVMKAQR
ncbi:MAG: integrase [Rhodospirillaceae bacterium]|nr:MAG: integrase [Rhodospirillaceae bacterium]